MIERHDLTLNLFYIDLQQGQDIKKNEELIDPTWVDCIRL